MERIGRALVGILMLSIVITLAGPVIMPLLVDILLITWHSLPWYGKMLVASIVLGIPLLVLWLLLRLLGLTPTQMRYARSYRR